MASEAEASCESDPNFAIICAFMEKFGELCGIPSIDFVELQQMLENNQEVSPELMNLHIKLLRKTKKNVTVERWERALINMCHNFSSKDAWEIERFGYKKTRLTIKLRALKELLEMQFDFNTKFKNEVNKITSEELRSQPLGRDKLGRAYWFQTDNNYQIRIYKEDPDEETWNLIAKDRDGLLSLITELSDGDSKLSSDSACNEDSNSLLEKPLIDTGQNDISIENKVKEIVIPQKDDEKRTPNFGLPSETQTLTFDDNKKLTNLHTTHFTGEENSVITEQECSQKSADELTKEEVVKPKEEEAAEIRRPMLRIKSLSELMEKPKELPPPRFLPDLPELTIIKKPRLDLSEITIVKKSKTPLQSIRTPQVSSVIESPLIIIKGNGSGRENKCGNGFVGRSVEDPFMLSSNKDLGRNYKTDNCCYKVLENKVKSINDKICNDLFIGDEIEEPVMYISGRGSGEECQTGNEDVSNVNKADEKLESSNSGSLTSQDAIVETANQVPISPPTNIKLGTIIDSKTDSKSFVPRSPNKKSRWDQRETQGIEMEEKNENNTSPKKMTFFFGPGSLNVKPNATLNSSSSDMEIDVSDKKNVVSDEIFDEAEHKITEAEKEVKEHNEFPQISETVEEIESALHGPDVSIGQNNVSRNFETTVSDSVVEQKEYCNIDNELEDTSASLKYDPESGTQSSQSVINVANEKENPQAECNKNQFANMCDEHKDMENSTNEYVRDSIKENSQNKYEDTSTEGVQTEVSEKEQQNNEITVNENLVDNVHIKKVPVQSAVMLKSEEKIFKNQENNCIPIEMKQKNLQHESEEKIHNYNEPSESRCKETKTEEISETKSPKEINLGISNKDITEATIENVSESIEGIEINKEIVPVAMECISLISNKSGNHPSEDSEALTSYSILKSNPEIVITNNTSHEKDSELKESVDHNLEQSSSNNENLSDILNEVKFNDKKAKPNDESEVGKPSDHPVFVDNCLNDSSINKQSPENKKKENIGDKKGESINKQSTAGQSSITNIIDHNVSIGEETLKSELISEGDLKEKVPKHNESLKQEDEVLKSEANPDVDINKKDQQTDDKSLKQEKMASSETNELNKDIETVEPVMESIEQGDKIKESKGNTKNTPNIKKRRGRKVTSDAKKAISENISELVELTAVRPVRQTRQTRATVVDAPPIHSAKGRGKRKATPQTIKNDETESTDSPIPLESVTVNDVDSNSAAADNTETDPLAVSEEDINITDQPMPSITSFSFDYDPSSPVSQLPVGKKNLRKRGRECLENKPEAGETLGKRAKIKGKRTVDLSLRKSVEEKRQKEVGNISSDDNESVASPIKKKETKMKKKGTPKKNSETQILSDSDNSSQKLTIKKNISKKRNARLLKNLGVKEEDLSAIADSPAPVRQSRRLAQIKIKEDAAIRRKIEEDDLTTIKKKKKKEDDKDFKGGKRKRFEEEVKPAPTPPMVEKKKRKKKKHNKISIGWNTSSEDSENSGKEDEVSEYEYEEPHEEEPLQFKSDHEFSPESDLEVDELPHKRARTARKEELDDGDTEEEFPCQKCGKSDHPEWILLCDKCDNGWHCSCLRPALFVIPEGDWFCPTCQHEKLLEKLNEKLIEFDKLLVKKEMEDRRKERLAYVGISLNNVLPAKDKKDKAFHKSSGSSVNGSESESVSDSADGSDSDEPIYQLRQRRQAHSYKFQDYDDLINSALQEEPPLPVEKTHTLGRGKDIATIVNAAKEEEERNAEKNGFEDLPPVVPIDISDSKKKALSYRKKPKRLNNLEVNSDDEADDSDEDFKGSSSDESDEEDFEEDSEDSFVGKKSSRPVRRSTRARTTRYDADFINDDSDDPSRKKKKKKIFFDDSESEQSDDWRGRKKKQRKISPHKKSKKKKKRFDDSDLETYRKKKPKIKYGIDSEDDTKGRRTRGKRTSYLDTLGSDSEEEALKKKSKDKSEDDEYVAEDEDKESEDEFDAELDKDSDEDRETREDRKTNSEKNSDSEEGSLVIKKLKPKKKRGIMDSEEEEEGENIIQKPQKIADEEAIEKSHTNNVQQPELNKSGEINEPDEPDKSDQVVPKKTDELRFEESNKYIPVKNDEPIQEKSEIIRELEKKALEKPPSVVVPMLNVEKLKACGITLTKVSKDKLDSSLNTDDAKSPSNLIEIGVKPIVSSLIQKNNQNLVPLTVERIGRDLESPNDGEVKEMMSDEECPNKLLPLTSTEMRSNLIKEEFNSAPSLDETKNFVKSPFSIMSNRKLGDNNLKKFRTGRFFNMRNSQESMLGSSVSLGMSNDDNDELSEPPGVALPLFSDIGSSSIHSIPKPSIINRIPRNCTPPPLSHNRTIPSATHGSGGPQLPAPMNVSANSTYPPILNSPAGINSHIRLHPPIGTSLGGTPISNIPISSNSPISGPAAPNIPVAVNMPLVHRSKSATPPSSVSPEGTPKKRRGRGKGKKTLAAEAAAAAAAAGLPLPEPNKTSPNKSLTPNIEIASPPQPFSQSQPAPSVITRMLQTSPGKGAFPVGRIRPKQFAMMPDVDNENEGSRSGESLGDPSHKDVPPAHPSRTGHPAGHYGTPVSSQYTQNFYQKESHAPPHSYHHQRPVQPPMHSYSQHPTQTTNDPSSLNSPALNQSQMNPSPMNQSPINQTSMNQPSISQPIINQSPLNPPPISQAPINLSASTPPPMTQYPNTSPASKQSYDAMTHRPPYGNTNSSYGYDYNAGAQAAVINTDEVLHTTSYGNTTSYPEQYDNSGSSLEPNIKNIEDEPSGEFGGLVSYFSSQHEDDLDT